MPLVELGRPDDNLRDRNLDDFVALGVPRRHFQPLRTHKKRLRNNLARSKVNMKITQCVFDETNNTFRLKVPICVHTRKELATTHIVLEYKAKVVAARERKFPWGDFEPLSKSVRRASSPQIFRKAANCGGNLRVFPDSSPICQNDTPTSPELSCCYDINLDVPIFGLAFGRMEKTSWLEFELACKSEATNGCLQQWRFMLPIKVMTSGYSSIFEVDEGTRIDSTQDDYEEQPVSNDADLMPLRIEPADIVM